MDLWYLRPLLIAAIEIGLAFVIFRHGKLLKYPFMLFCLLLAGYQLGEYLLVSDFGGRLGFQIAMFSTTLLPPLGIYLVEKFTHRNWGYEIWQGIGGALAIVFLVNPYVVAKVDVQYCFCKFAAYSENWSAFMLVWAIYYTACLTFACAVLSYVWLRQKHFKAMLVKYIWWAYICFYPTSFAILLATQSNLGYVTSVMCALALIAALIATYSSVKFTDRDL